MFELIIFPLLKVIGSFTSVALASAVKASKDEKKYETNLEHIQTEINRAGRARQNYGDNAKLFMDSNYPRTIFFPTELFANIHRPLLVLYLIMVLYQQTFPIILMAALSWLSFFFIEQKIDKLKKALWYRLLLSIIWILTYPILIWSEYLTHYPS